MIIDLKSLIFLTFLIFPIFLTLLLLSLFEDFNLRQLFGFSSPDFVLFGESPFPALDSRTVGEFVSGVAAGIPPT